MNVPPRLRCPFCEKTVEEMRVINTGGNSRVTLWTHEDGELHWKVHQPRDGVGIVQERKSGDYYS